MYQIEAWSSLKKIRQEADLRFRRVRVSPNVWALGFTSLFTDVSSEMVGTVLPVYLVLYLGLTPLTFGLVDGLHYGVTALLRLASGVAVDRFGRCRELAAVGYAVSAVSRLGLLAAGASWPLIAAVVALDRAAKGARTVPRDVLISLSSREDALATSFGVHRALDSAGAMLGPLVALAVLGFLPNAFDVVFVSSFSVALLGLGVLLLFVRNVRVPATDRTDAQAGESPVHPILASSRMRRVVGVASGLSLATVSDGFLYLMLQESVGFPASLFPVLYVGTAATYLLLAVPAGRVADVVGRQRAFLGAYALLAIAYLVTLGQGHGLVGVVGCLVLLGAYYALSDGVLMALTSGWLHPSRRGSGLAVLTTTTSVARLGASILFGALWTQFGTEVAVVVFLVGLVGAIGVAAFLLPGDRGASDG